MVETNLIYPVREYPLIEGITVTHLRDADNPLSGPGLTVCGDEFSAVQLREVLGGEWKEWNREVAAAVTCRRCRRTEQFKLVLDRAGMSNNS